MLLFVLFKNDATLQIGLQIFKSVFLFSFFLIVLPSIVLYINYKVYDYSIKLGYKRNTDGRIEFEYQRNDVQIKFYDNEIKLIESYLSFALYEERMPWLFWDNCYYNKIILTNGESICVTCVTCNRLFDKIPTVKRVKEKLFFPIIL